MKKVQNKFKKNAGVQLKTFGRYDIFFIFLVLFGFRVLQPILQQSPTYDEGVKIGASYSFVKEGYPYYDIENPPFFKLLFSIPLFILKPNIPVPEDKQRLGNSNRFEHQFAFGYQFLYHNSVPARKLLLSVRLVSFFIYLLGGTALFFFLRKFSSANAAFLGALFYFTCPNLAAAGANATNDIFTVLLTIIFLFSLVSFSNEPNIKNAVFTGIALGLAISVKYSLLIFVVFYLVVLITVFARKKLTFTKMVIYSGLVFSLTVFVIEANYLFIDPKIVFKIIKMVVGVMNGGKMAYMLGLYSDQGFAFYYPLAFILKTPVPIIIFLLFSFYVFLLKKKCRDNTVMIVFIGMALFVCGSMISKLNLGLRYFLPVYPFVYLFSPLVVVDRVNFGRKIIPLMVVLLVVSNMLIHPNYQSYFNLLIGKNENAYKYLSDSSLDWGQNLGDLSCYLKKEGSPELILSYFGTASPAYYGLVYQNIASNGLDACQAGELNAHLNSDRPRKEYLAISATCLVGLDYPDHSWFYFLYDYQPIKILGNTIFVYDITNRIDAYKKMAEIYFQTDSFDHFLRSGRRINALDLNDVFGRLAKSVSLLRYQNDFSGAEKNLDNLVWLDIAKSDVRLLAIKTALMYIGMLIKQKKYQPALDHLTGLLELDSNDLNYKLYSLRGIVYMQKQEYKLAEDNFRKSIAGKPGYPASYYNLGLLYEKMNNLEKARRMYRAALDNNPGYLPAKRKLGLVIQKSVEAEDPQL